MAPSNWNNAKHYYSLESNIKKVIEDVANRTISSDNFFYTAHGNWNYGCCQSLCTLDADGDGVGEDEDVTPTELDSWLDRLKCDQLVILLQGCCSGCFIDGLAYHNSKKTWHKDNNNFNR